MKILFAVLAVAAAVVAVCLIRAARLKAKPSGNAEHKKEFDDDTAAVDRFCEILRKKTVWPRNGNIDYAEFDAFLPLLKRLYPAAFAVLEENIINNYGILLRWKGKKPGAKPFVLMAHYDVVEVDESKWDYPPFGAEIHDGSVYARGALDTKCIISAELEAVTYLIEKGFEPESDIWFSYTNNEETGGDTTPAVVEFFKQNAIEPRFVLDEGGAVVTVPDLGVKGCIAMIGVCEKGICDTVVTAQAKPGHSSKPMPGDAPDLLADCIESIRKIHFKPRLAPVVRDMLKGIGAYSPFVLRLAIGNMRLFAPVIKLVMKKNGESNAVMRTTICLTQLKGSDTINVIPAVAQAGYSVRIAPWDSVDKVLAVIRKAVGKKAEVKAEYSFEPSPVSDYRCAEFELLKNTINTVYPDAGVSPMVMTGGTDSKHFAKISKNVYRFAGFRFTPENLAGMHGNNEAVGVKAYLDGIDFYIELIRNFNRGV
ncbi:MAG: M20/M25/M40 family metallo-hydrolase [Clostridia bacterium]|nr:M20/M25/M40 family metallo-hydrolase [Clostridia bacterium]